jgi:hypothetical protein
MLRDVVSPAVTDPHERGKLAHLLARSRVCANEGAQQFQGTLSLFLAEPADEQLQPLPRCHTSRLTVSAKTCRAQNHQAVPVDVARSSAGPARTGPSAFIDEAGTETFKAVAVIAADEALNGGWTDATVRCSKP